MSICLIVCLSDSNYAGDTLSRRSIISFIIYVLCVPVSWGSKYPISVALSSSEAEWVALSEAAKEVMFMIQLLGSMKISVKLPIMIRVDNVCG